MSFDSSIVQAHSVAEAYLYLKVSPCPHCHRGLLEPTLDLTRESETWRLPCKCRQCGKPVEQRFQIDPPPTRESAQSKIINPTDSPSRAIDLVGWLNLFQLILSAAGRSQDRIEGRELALEAAACLDEALKFYRDGNEMPPESAFFSAAGRTALREHPQRFLRSTWLQRRMTLPNAAAATKGPADPQTRRRRWWPFGRKRAE
ncbi:MAG: hypothetical protein H6819_01515 [Phycisphaerales bacterium]|nr:hypothetical protein [Phycisphaerales bacterium]MCB9857113.1 hypothetical protein [Phycisphaerales bacterium]MCB9861760.1 hypothetical protein [Phycisphaerales bacterium]